jgi:hypothetical protein
MVIVRSIDGVRITLTAFDTHTADEAQGIAVELVTKGNESKKHF